MAYELPINGDGTVALPKFLDDVLAFLDEVLRDRGDIRDAVGMIEVLTAHYEALGAEKERDKCCVDVRLNFSPFRDEEMLICDRIINAIRARGASEAPHAD